MPVETRSIAEVELLEVRVRSAADMTCSGYLERKGTRTGQVPFLNFVNSCKRSLLQPKSIEQDAVLVATYVPEAEFNVTYYKSVSLISGATITQAFQVMVSRLSSGH
jgi:hypothetical protein